MRVVHQGTGGREWEDETYEYVMELRFTFRPRQDRTRIRLSLWPRWDPDTSYRTWLWKKDLHLTDTELEQLYENPLPWFMEGML